MVKNLVSTCLVAAAAIGLSALSVSAESFPSKPIQLIVPWPAGGGTDLVARLVSSSAEKHLGVPIVIMNRPGAGGAVGTAELARAKPDGYTIGIDGPGFISRQYTLANHPKVSDLQPIVWIGGDPLAIAVRSESKWRNLEEFLEEARSRRILLSGLQPGSSFYNSTLIFENVFNVEFSKIPYPGFAQMGPAMQAGEIEAGIALVTDWVPFVRDGSVRLLGVMARDRHYMAKDVPTIEEATGKPFEQSVWRSLFAPAGVPAERIEILEKAFMAGMSDPELRKKAENSGWIIDPAPASETLARWTAADDETYPILQALGMVVAPRK